MQHESATAMSERKVKIIRTSTAWRMSKDDPEEVLVTSLADLEALIRKYGEAIILDVGPDGKIETVEIYDDYRE